MRNAKRATSLSKAVPVLGIAGVTLSMAGGASASTTGPLADVPSRNMLPPQVITLGEEEISDVSLATFYVFDKENAGKPQLGEQLARVVREVAREVVREAVEAAAAVCP